MSNEDPTPEAVTEEELALAVRDMCQRNPSFAELVDERLANGGDDD